jgi:hypothetical protein
MKINDRRSVRRAIWRRALRMGKREKEEYASRNARET